MAPQGWPGAPPNARSCAATDAPAAFRVMFLAYAGCAMVALWLFARLSGAVEAGSAAPRLGLGRSRPVVYRLAGLFALDSLAGGFVVQSLIAFYLYLRWGAGPEVLGPVFL